MAPCRSPATSRGSAWPSTCCRPEPSMSTHAHRGQPAFERALAILRGGAPADLQRGVEALDAAMAAGAPDASCRMAAFTADGIGVPQSWERAFDLLLRAALGGSIAARGQLVVLAGAEAGGAAGDDASDTDTLDGGRWRALRDKVRLA